jgi:hypothetical protein
MFNVSDIVERNRRDTENYNYTSKIRFSKYLIGYNKYLKYKTNNCKIVYMKHENRISKILEKKVLMDEDPKLIAEIEKHLAGLEVVWKKWVKAHPNWKEQED